MVDKAGVGEEKNEYVRNDLIMKQTQTQLSKTYNHNKTLITM